jgi:hypothetical protein
VAAEDIHAQISLWVADEVRSKCLADDYGWSVTLLPVSAQTPAGVQVIPLWHLLLTTRNPLLGEGPLFHFVPIPMPARPDENMVRGEVGEGMAALRDLARKKLAGGNGKPAALHRG